MAGQKAAADRVATTLHLPSSAVLPYTTAAPVSTIGTAEVLVVVASDLASTATTTTTATGPERPTVPGGPAPVGPLTPAEPLSPPSSTRPGPTALRHRLRRDPVTHRGRPGHGPPARRRAPALLAPPGPRFAAVAVVSGRPAAFLVDRLGQGPPDPRSRVRLVGLYGMEWPGPTGGAVWSTPPPRGWPWWPRCRAAAGRGPGRRRWSR